MRILQINASYKPAYIYGGPTMSVSELSEQLTRLGKDVEVYTTTANGETELNVRAGKKTIVEGVPVTYFRRITKGNSHFSPALLISLWKKFRHKTAFHPGLRTFSNHQIIKSSNQPPLVHIHAWWNFVSVGSCFLALLFSRKVILSPRGTLSNYSFGNRTILLKNIFHQAIGRRMLRRCHFHVTSEKEKADLLKLLNPRSVTVIPNFVKMSFQSSAKQSETRAEAHELFKLIFLSRVEEKKGLDVLLKALTEVRFNYKLTIAGTGDEEYIRFLKLLASELEITERINWIGHQDTLQKFRNLEEHDLMVLPSHDESFANVVIESLSVGTPVLISSKVGLAEYVSTNDLGWEYESTAGNLAHELTAAFNDLEKRKHIRGTAPERIAKDFDDEHLIAKYLTMYQTIENV